MYPPQFDYYRATSVDEALSLLQEHSGAKLLAGGHSLIPTLKLRLADPGVLVDIGRIDSLRGISRENGTLRIGALTTHATVAASDDVPAALPDAASKIGDPQVRNVGTVGGNVAHADPASDLPTVLVALDATLHMQGPNGTRSIAAEEFFVDLFFTELGYDEILTAITIPVDGAGTAYAKLSNPASRYAIVGAAAKVTVSGGTCSAARVAVGGLTPCARRVTAVEEALVGQPLNQGTIEAAAAKFAGALDDDIMGDIHASADYRNAMAPVYIARALTKAAERVG